jgi:antitoxin component of MazEF toxin-antitoxin module
LRREFPFVLGELSLGSSDQIEGAALARLSKMLPRLYSAVHDPDPLAIRRIGNGFGVIIPKRALEVCGVGVGEPLELPASGIAPQRRVIHDALDEHKRKLVADLAARFPASAIRACSFANLQRWQAAGAWVSAHDEWVDLRHSGDDSARFAAMSGRDERANRLRQSPPYLCLLRRDEVATLDAEVD